MAGTEMLRISPLLTGLALLPIFAAMAFVCAPVFFGYRTATFIALAAFGAIVATELANEIDRTRSLRHEIGRKRFQRFGIGDER